MPTTSTSPATSRTDPTGTSNDRARRLFGLAPSDLGRVLQDLEISYRPIELRSHIEEAQGSRSAVVIKDAPEKMLYIAVLLMPRDDRRNFKEFTEIYEKTPDSDTLWQNWFMEDRRREFRRRVLEQLRAEAAAPNELDGEGKFKYQIS